MSNNHNFCNNCGKTGHIFNQCKYPITSVGIISFRQVNSVYQYLMIKRKDTLGYIDFMRGKYPINNKAYILNIIDEMTIDEKNRLKNNTFDFLWTTLWGNNVGIQYRGEENGSRDKFERLKMGVMSNDATYTLESLILESSTNWTDAEWGFPKGRRNHQEKELTCALREFEEETGYHRTAIQIIQNLLPFEETFTGSNYKSYKHKYYVAKMNPDEQPTHHFQECEVSDIKWATYTEACALIRPYNLEKIDVLTRVNTLLNEYRLYP